MEKKSVGELMKVDSPGPQPDFPPRPHLATNPKGTKVKLSTNFFSIKLKTENYVYVYSVKFVEDIPQKNTPLRKKLVNGLRKEIEAKFQKFIFTGINLFSPKDLGTDPIVFKSAENKIEYLITFQIAHRISLDDIKYPHKDPSKAQTANTFLNIIIKSLLMANKMVPVGRTGKYLLPSESKSLADYGIDIWPGYKTSVKLCEGGLLLEVDYTSRILSKTTAYSKLREIMSRGGNPQAEAKAYFIGRSVIAWYGNKQNYIISDIDFTTNPDKYEFDTQEGRVSMFTYLQKKYNLILKDRKQPLLVCTKKAKDGKEEKIYLAPEIFGLTGLPDGMREDFHAMKQIAVYTKLTPDQRTDKMNMLLKKFSSLSIDDKKEEHEATKKRTLEQPGKIMRDWGIEIDPHPKEVEGRILPAVGIKLGGGASMEMPPNGQFFFKQPIVTPLPLDKWILVHTGKDKVNADAFVDTLYNASKTFGITVDFPKYAETRGVRAKDFIEATDSMLKTNPNPQMVVFILPPPSVDEYKHIKKWATTLASPLLTQCIKSKTLGNQKGLMAICSKIILQITSKRNGELWRVTIPEGVPKKTMMVGIDVSREGGSTFLGFASSYDPFFSKYFTQIQRMDAKQEISNTLGNLMVRALARFLQETKKFLPEELIIYRDGVGDMQKIEVYQQEISSILTSIGEKYPDFKPKIMFATVNKKVHTRIFTKDGPAGGRGGRRGYSDEGKQILSNPAPGTVVHSGITNSSQYEFLIMPQFVNEGTGTPAKVHVLYDTTGMPPELFEELTNVMCYGYDNWQGAIRTPAPCKYALSHAKLAAKYTKTSPNELLLSYKYFL